MHAVEKFPHPAKLLPPLFCSLEKKASVLDRSPFYLPYKNLIFVRLQLFLHAGRNYLHPEELSPHAKNYE